MTTADLEQELVSAWEWWDEHPKDGAAANRMEGLCRTVSADLGLTSSELRITLAALRRLGRLRHIAVSDAVGFFTERGAA